ncbi:4-amino-4-deoxy-L-arabinose transferase-like glycosyltransferase [Neolewinella xylanilytica]|uniref:4-amino-4-deoxy-L-arabinose transferase-like glycosyltransferase n=1 Tax=Neolewinella xylanilytica TaxID=1514080 RepID=A0A2S6I9G5_9BACT|nr:glycosyltransferase family 39 protein [Neolewinella xylanilytica]PPK88128.1 4-amino-4-deoxy-L-arabinose transferase-like glycosyltransferase [Neolewinella xylanilytica]
MRHRPWIVPVLFFILAVAIRWGSFSVSVINHDESTYIVGADELLRGEIYLRDVIDTKPIGIFWLYALLIKLTGGSIWLLRLAATAFVALGAWLLAVVAERATGKPGAGYVAGTVYIIMCSVYKFYGVSPNTEIFFNVFTIGAVAATVVAPRKRWWLAGLLLGVGFVIKPFVAAEALAIGLFLVWWYRRQPARMVGHGLVLVGAFLLPVAGVVAYFAQLGMLPELWFYTFEVGSAYPIDLPWYLRLKYMGDYLLRYSPFFLLGVVAQVRGQVGKQLPVWLTYLALQALLVSVVVLLTGKRFGHYQVQLHPVMALYTGTCVGLVWSEVLRRRWVPWAVAVVSIGLGIGHAFYYAGKDDEPRIIADYLRDRLPPGETFFAINGFQISYHLLDRPVPTPYIHSSLLFYDHHARAFRIDEAAEAQRILADTTVTYLVGRKDDSEATTLLGRTLIEAFEPVGDINEDLRAWNRKKPD